MRFVGIVVTYGVQVNHSDQTVAIE